MACLRLLTCLCFVLSTFSAMADEAVVAVASNFLSPMNALVRAFQKTSSHRIKVTYGASGLIYSQVRNGAPFDIFLSADQVKPEALEREGLAVPGHRFTYGVGKLVLWSSRAGLIDQEGQVLKTLKFKRLVIANPRVAPYGMAARDVLKALKIERAVKGRLIYANNISQAHQFVASGNADIGLVSYSLVMSSGKLKSGSVWVVPERYYAAIKQDAVLLVRGKNNKAAKDFLKFLRGSEAEEIIKAYGYSVAGDKN